jgi:hypothetical protein
MYITMERLQKIRELEGQFDFRESAEVIYVPKVLEVISPTGKEPCAFARLVSYMSSKLYNCTSKQQCDSAISYGSPRKYCKKELEKD